jgi:uncharacterized protein YdcH (DUF465 family)
MTDDEIRKKMEFIIEQQAQFAADIQQLRETQAAHFKIMNEKHNTLTEALTTVVGMIGKLSVAQERTDANVAELAEKMITLADAQASTDERLNMIIGMIERYFSDGRNGTSQG